MFQKLFSMFFAYIIGFQLVVGAIPHHALNSSAWADTCSSGLQWNEMLGRCVTTAQASQLADASKMCESQSDEAAKRQCYRDVVDGKMKDEGVAEAGKIKMGMIPVAMAMISLASAAAFLMTGGPAKCPGATSAYLMVGGAVAVMAGEVMSAMTYKKKLKAAEEKFKSIADSSKSDDKSSSDNSSATSAQGEAFQAMIELEEATISAAKTKNMLYMVATAAYAAAAVMSAIETMRYQAAMIAVMYPPTSAPAKAEIISQTCADALTSNGINTEVQHYAFLGTDEMPLDRQAPSSLAEAYVDNFFTKKQNVNFSSYLLSNADSSSNVTEFSYLIQEQLMLRQGANAGPSYAGYHEIRNQIESRFHHTQEEFSAMKVASNVINSFWVPEAKAGVGDFLPLAAMAGGLTLAGLSGGAFALKKLYLLPMSRMALAAAMTANNIFMISKTNKEKSKAEERKKFIENLKAQVEAAGAEFGCANNDRNNLSKPNCYCYSEGGGLNPSRVNSATCKNLFGAKPLLASGKANNPTAVSNQKNCVTSKGALDSSCSCRTSNTCVSVKSPSVIGNVPAGNVLGNLPQTLNGLNSGSLSAADINGEQFGTLAARLKNMNDKLINDPKNKALALEVKKAKAQGEKAVKDIERGLGGSMLATGPSSGSGGFTNASSPAAALEAMKNDLSQQIKGYEGNVVPVAGGTAARKTDDFSLDALSGTGGVTVSDEQLAEAMNSQYDMGNSDINTDSGANIFSILSSRYQRSGMRRLFGGEALVPADKPASTEISR